MLGVEFDALRHRRRAVRLRRILLDGHHLARDFAPDVHDDRHDEIVHVLAEQGRAEHRTTVEIPFDAKRSEEHTSELQSLMRISYAVFCLKKKNTKNNKDKK